MLTSNHVNFFLAKHYLSEDFDWEMLYGALDAPWILCAGATYQYPLQTMLIGLPKTFSRSGG